VKADPALLQMSKNPYFQDALKDATKLAEANNISPKTDLTQFLQYVKEGLDKQLTRTGDTALAAAEKKAVQDVKGQLLGWLAQKNPTYEQARSNFAARSRPINQMQVGQLLEQKLVPALESGERAGVFAQAKRDAPKTIQTATNSPFSSMNEILTPRQNKAVEGVLGSLQRDAAMDALAKGGMREATERIGVFSPGIPSTGIFDPKLSFMRGVINRVAGKATDRALSEAARMMAEDPQGFARAMQSVAPGQRKAIIDKVLRFQAAPAASMGTESNQ